MQKVIIDTNVLVSAFITRSFPYQILYRLFLGNKIKLCVSDDLMREYYEVINRPKFARYTDFLINAESLLADIKIRAIDYQPKMRLNIIADINDSRLLELADESDANFLITGNTNDFTFKQYKQTKIVTPKEYWESYQPD